jgi:hypothetical protein
VRNKVMAALAAVAIVAAPLATLGISSALGASDVAQPCAQLPAHTSYICITTDAFKGPWSADYWADEAYMRTMMWHPADGDLAVSETYFCRPGTVNLGSGHVNSVDAGSTSDEKWCIRGAPGLKVGIPEWDARIITVADGCIVWGWHVTDTQEPPPVKPTKCLGEFTGKITTITPLEQTSVLEFWRSMKLEPGAW